MLPSFRRRCRRLDDVPKSLRAGKSEGLILGWLAEPGVQTLARLICNPL